MHSIPVICHGLLRLNNVFKHGLDLVHGIVPAFNLQLFDHELLGLIGDTGLVKESLSQQIGEAGNEHITAMEAAEQSHDGIKSLLDFVVAD